MKPFREIVREYISKKGALVVSLLSFGLTLIGGIFVLREVPGWLFLSILSLSLILLHFSSFTIKTNKKHYHYKKLHEEYHAHYIIEESSNIKTREDLNIRSISKHTYSVEPTSSSLEVMQHEFTVFIYDALAYKHENRDFLIGSLECNQKATIKQLDFSDKIVRFRLQFVPEISPPNILKYSFAMECNNSMFLTHEDLFDAVSRETMPAERSFCFRAMYVDAPTDRVIVKIEFPVWYQIRNVAPLVMYNGKIITEIQLVLKVQKDSGIKTNTYSLEVLENHLHVGFHYAISWLPPTFEELQAQMLKGRDKQISA